MGLFGRDEGKLRGRGIEGTAVIRESDRSGAAFGQFSDFEILNRVGTRTYRFTLEVTIPDRDPYETTGKFEVPRKAENTGFLPGSRSIGKPLQPGLELPVRVDPADPGVVEVDWDKFMASPGRKDAQLAASQAAYNREVAKQASKNPKLVKQMKDGNRVAVQSWAVAVRGGQMSREEFEDNVTTEIESGRMDAADAEAARASLDG